MSLRKVCCVALIAALTSCLATEARAGGFLKKLFGKQSECCEPAPEPECCEPAPEPVCCEPAPVECCEPAPEPVCCEPAPEPCCEPAPAPEPCCASMQPKVTTLMATASTTYYSLPVAYSRVPNYAPVQYASTSYYPVVSLPSAIAPSMSYTVAGNTLRYVSTR